MGANPMSGQRTDHVLRLLVAQGAAPTLFDGNLYVRPRAASNRTWITR